MKIVMLRSNPVNPDPRVEKEVNSLLKDKHKINIVAWDRNTEYKNKKEVINFNNGNAEITKFGIKSEFGAGFKKNLFPLIKFQLKLFKWLIQNRKEYDIIHACDFDTVIPAYICKKFLGKKYIYDIFDYYVDAFSVPKRLKKYIKSLDHIMINNADSVIIFSEMRKNQILGTTPKKIEVIHNSPSYNLLAFNDESLKRESGDKVKIVYVGILNDDRFICELIDLIKEYQELELHIGGFGKYEYYVKKESDNYNNIKYYGKLGYTETLELEKKCDLMVAIYNPKIPNHYYAAPNKFYEALMLGKPLIMAKNTGMDNIIVKYNIGEVVEYNKESVIDGIFKLINRKSEWNNISFTMRNIFIENYSWDEMERRLLRLYKDI